MSFTAISSQNQAFNSANPIQNVPTGQIPPGTAAQRTAADHRVMVIREMGNEEAASTHQALLIGQQNQRKILVTSIITVFQKVDKQIAIEHFSFLTTRQFCELAKIVLLAIGAEKAGLSKNAFEDFFEKEIFKFDDKGKVREFYDQLWTKVISDSQVIRMLFNALEDTFQLLELNLIQEMPICSSQNSEDHSIYFKFVFRNLNILKLAIESSFSTLVEDCEKKLFTLSMKKLLKTFPVQDHLRSLKTFEKNHWPIFTKYFQFINNDHQSLKNQAAEFVNILSKSQMGFSNLTNSLLIPLVKFQVNVSLHSSNPGQSKVVKDHVTRQYIEATDLRNKFLKQVGLTIKELFTKEVKIKFSKLQERPHLNVIVETILRSIGNEGPAKNSLVTEKAVTDFNNKLFEKISLLRKKWCAEFSYRMKKYSYTLAAEEAELVFKNMLPGLRGYFKKSLEESKGTIRPALEVTIRELIDMFENHSYIVYPTEANCIKKHLEQISKQYELNKKQEANVLNGFENAVKNLVAYRNSINFFLTFMRQFIAPFGGVLSRISDNEEEFDHIEMENELTHPLEQSEIDAKSQIEDFAQDSKKKKAQPSTASAASASAVPSSLPAISPINFIEPADSMFKTTASKAVHAFGYSVAQLYGLDPRQIIKPATIKKLKYTKSHIAVLQHLSSLQAFGRNLERFENSLTIQSKVVYLKRALLQGFLSVEQLITAECVVKDKQFVVRHNLTYLLENLGIRISNIWTEHNNKGTLMLRYPAGFSKSGLPFVLEHAARGGSKTVKEFAKMKMIWIQDAIHIIAGCLELRFCQHASFFERMKKISDSLKAAPIEVERDIKAKESQAVGKVIGNAANAADNLDFLIPSMMNKMQGLAEDTQNDKIFNYLDNAVYHIRNLRDNIRELDNCNELHHPLDDAQAILIHAQYFVYHLAKYHVSKTNASQGSDSFQNLLNDLCEMLTARQIKTFKSLKVGKGSEYLYRYFNENSEITASMQLLNDFFGENDLKLASNGMQPEAAPQHKKLLSFVDDITDLTRALVPLVIE